MLANDLGVVHVLADWKIGTADIGVSNLFVLGDPDEAMAGWDLESLNSVTCEAGIAVVCSEAEVA